MLERHDKSCRAKRWLCVSATTPMNWTELNWTSLRPSSRVQISWFEKLKATTQLWVIQLRSISDIHHALTMHTTTADCHHHVTKSPSGNRKAPALVELSAMMTDAAKFWHISSGAMCCYARSPAWSRQKVQKTLSKAQSSAMRCLAWANKAGLFGPTICTSADILITTLTLTPSVGCRVCEWKIFRTPAIGNTILC